MQCIAPDIIIGITENGKGVGKLTFFVMVAVNASENYGFVICEPPLFFAPAIIAVKCLLRGEVTMLHVNLYIYLFLIILNIPNYSEIFLNIPKYSQIFPNIPEYSQIFLNIPKYS